MAARPATELPDAAPRCCSARAFSDAYGQGERGIRYVAHQIEVQPLVSILLAGAIGYLAAYTIHARR